MDGNEITGLAALTILCGLFLIGMIVAAMNNDEVD